MSALKSQSRFVRYTSYALFGLLVMAFGLWGIGDIFRSGGRLTVVATVGDREIPTDAFAQALRREIQTLQRESGGRLTRDQLLSLEVVQRALGPLVERALFDNLAEDMGLVVSDQQVLARIQQQPDFQNTQGRFDRRRFEEVLRANNMTEAQFVSALRVDILRNYLLIGATESVAMPDVETSTLFGWLDERRVAQYLEVEAATMSELPEPAEEALQQVYEDYSARFEAPEYRSVTLLHLAAETFLADVIVNEAELEAWFQANRQSYVVPERRALRQLVFRDQTKAEAALAALQGGQSLDEVAAADGATAIPLPAQSKDELAAILPPLAEAAFALPAEQRFGLAQSALGFHVFEVTEIEPGKEPTLEDVRAELTQDYEMNRAVETLISIANQVDAEMSTGATLDEVAQKLDLPLRKIEAVDKQGRDREGKRLEGLPSPQQVLPLIFADEPGLETPLSEADDGSYYAFRVDNVTPPATRPFAEVEDEVRSLWVDLERKRLAHEKAEDLVKRIEHAQIDLVAALQGLQIKTTGAMNRFETSADVTPSPALPEALFAAETGKPFAVDTEQGSLVAVLTLILPARPDQAPERLERLQLGLDRSLATDVVREFLASLRRDYPVLVNQQAVDEILQTF